MEHKISVRGLSLPGSPIRKLAGVAEEAKAKGRKIYHLNIGQPDIETPSQSIEKVKGDDCNIIAYGPAQGNHSLRKVYAAYYQKFKARFEADDIIVTTGASEAILFALNATCNPGDEVIIPEPFYANYISFAAFCGVQVVPITGKIENQFALPNPEAFEQKINHKTKAILLCNPSNPTGKIYNKAALEKIIALAIKYELFIIVDEVYKEFCYEKNFESITQFEQAAQHVIVLDSISKIFSSCGARIGFLATRNSPLRDAILKACQMRLCPPYFGQLMAEEAFTYMDEYLPKVKEEYKARRAKVYELVSKIEGVQCYLPDGAFYLIAELPVEDADEFCKWLLTDFEYEGQSVMLSPASGFYANKAFGKRQVRIAFVLNEGALEKAINCLEKGLEAYKSIAFSPSTYNEKHH